MRAGLVRDQLPDRIESRLDIPLDACQQELHDAGIQAAGILAQIAKRRPLTPGESNRLMAHLQQARMACDAAGLVDKETEGSPKLDELANLLDELCLQSGLKAVVFSQWEQMTRMVEERVRALGLGCVRLHGGVPTSKRGELIDRFNDDDACQVFISTDAGGVGLNLQTASVLINLDIPWNPAVLDQRIARVHRLGQTRKVQIILLVAAESYECRVLELVQGKRNLFDNVVDQDATEDVVGVSRKLVEVLAEDLVVLAGVPKTATETPEGQAAQIASQESASEQADADPTPVPDIDASPDATTTVDDAATDDRPVERAEPIPLADANRDAEMEESIRHAIEAAQNAFGTRIERILGSGGGLLVVLDRVDAEADRLAAAIAGQVPVALIDPRTLSGLRRLGDASPIAHPRPLVEPSEDRRRPQEPRLLSRAREKLRGAEVLIQQACPAPAMDLLLGALLACAAVRAEQKTSPTPQQAGIWLYSEALPKGILTQDEAGLLMRALALSQGAEAIPDALLRDLAADVARFVAGTG